MGVMYQLSFTDTWWPHVINYLQNYGSSEHLFCKEIKVACLIYKGCIQQRFSCNMRTKAKCTESAKYRYQHW